MKEHDFCIKGTLDMLVNGKVTISQCEEIVNIWIKVTREKAYAEGLLVGLRRNNALSEIAKKSHQALCDMTPESDYNYATSVQIMSGVHSGLTGEKEG